MMEKFRFKLNVTFFLIVVTLLLGSSCGQKREGKIPITTSSSEALKFYLEGRDLSEKLRREESIPYFEKAIAKDPNFALAYLNLAINQSTAKAFFEYLKKAEALVDSVSEGEKYIIYAFRAAVDGANEKEKKYYQKLVELYPEDERAHNLLGNYYFGEQEYNIAIGKYRRATEINSNFSQPYNQLGYSHRFLGNYQEAEEAFQKYIELIPKDPNPYDSYADLQMKMGKFKASIKTCEKALKNDPYFIASHIGIINNLIFLDRYDEAKKQLKKLYNIARNDGERLQARYASAVAFVHEGDIDNALKQLQLSYDLSSNIKDDAFMARDMINIGQILFEQEKYDEALQNYTKAMNIIENSDLSETIKENTKRYYLFHKARIDLMKGNLEEAKETAEKFRFQAFKAKNRSHIWLSHELAGTIALKENNYDEALGELARSNLQNPYNLFRMSQAFEKKGEKAKAKEYCEKAANHNTMNSLNYALIRYKAQQKLNEM
jgi:tetratricopeptide (TPR) repeat protein